MTTTSFSNRWLNAYSFIQSKWLKVCR